MPFTSATAIAVCMFAAYAGFLFLNALYLQEVLGMPPFRTGTYTLPLALMMVRCAPISGRMIGRLGTGTPLLVAGVATVASALLLTRLDEATPLTTLVLAYVIFGIGFGLINPPITNTAVSGMPRAQAGLAAAVAATSRQVGASLGVALSGSIASVGASQHGGGSDFPAATHAFLVAHGGLRHHRDRARARLDWQRGRRVRCGASRPYSTTPRRAPVSTSAAAFAPRRSDRARGREATVLGYSGRTATVSV